MMEKNLYPDLGGDYTGVFQYKNTLSCPRLYVYVVCTLLYLFHISISKKIQKKKKLGLKSQSV